MARLREQLAASQSTVEDLEQKKRELTERVQKSEQQVEQLTGSHTDETDGERQLSELRARIRALQDEKDGNGRIVVY